MFSSKLGMFELGITNSLKICKKHPMKWRRWGVTGSIILTKRYHVRYASLYNQAKFRFKDIGNRKLNIQFLVT